MNPKHSDPSYSNPRLDSKTGEKVWARAPYNFVRLPERIITVELPPDQDIYSGNTGFITCEVVTRSPTYIRGMSTPESLKLQTELEKAEEERINANRKVSQQEKDTRNEQESTIKELQAPFFSSGERSLIPGSSLRGMIRNIVEIITYSKIRWVGNEPSFSFRAVAAQNNDPLRDPYRNLIGSNGKNIRAGYLNKVGDQWEIQPARMPSDQKLPETSGYLKVKERNIDTRLLPGYLEFNSPNYLPQIFDVCFDTSVGKDRNGRPITAISHIGPRGAGFKYNGVMVSSGNMLETGKSSQKSPRKNLALILEASSKKKIRISTQAVNDYLVSLTPYQKENLTAWGGEEWGCLCDGAPVFYIDPGRDNEVIYFGHSPNFRVPIRLPGADHASNPLDFIPSEMRKDEVMDSADAIFGWTPEPDSQRKSSCAGRVFFGDATLLTEGEDIWFKPQTKTITPHVLSGAKATTFQHYLVQDKALGHDPDSKKTLAHYGTLPPGTQIRGRKQYWHQGSSPQIEANTTKELEHESQLTRIQPLKAGVRFAFTVRFENLSETELGAILWALQPHGNGDETCVHKIGMGKPLGMGAVHIDRVDLHLTDRVNKRYARLFDESAEIKWNEGFDAIENDFAGSFEQTMLTATSETNSGVTSFAELPPVQDLITMMAWRGEDPGITWSEWTRYMEIEHGSGKLNEFKERPVLPTPAEVVKWSNGKFTHQNPFVHQGSSKSGQTATQVTKQLPVSVTRPPEPGDSINGEVMDVEPGGKVYLIVVTAQEPAVKKWLREVGDTVEIVAEIQSTNRGSRTFRDGDAVRLEVLSVQEDANGWLIDCRLAK